MLIISSIRILIDTILLSHINPEGSKLFGLFSLKNRSVIVLICISCIINLSYAQKANVDSVNAPRIAITTIPVRLTFRDINLGVAFRIRESQTLEVRLGWVHANKFLHRNLYEPGFTSTEMNYHGASVYFQWNKWRISRAGKPCYFGIIGGYRYLFYTDKSMWMGGFGGSSDAEELLLSQWRNDIFILGSLGLKTSKNSTAEVSAGVRVNYTHTNVVDTRFHPVFITAQEYEEYKRNSINGLPYSKGWGILPVIRFTSRIGWFSW